MISVYLDWVCLIIYDMSNDWFRFRQFLIRQDRSAMKVGTDGVLLGSWVDCESSCSVLDVGTGTGLISLMIAQRNSVATITAIEIDSLSAIQARENVMASKWADRISVVEADFRVWEPEGRRDFDLIVCNPPFFTRSLKNPNSQRATARHDDELPLSELVKRASGMLSFGGRLAIVLPVNRLEEAMEIAGLNGLSLYQKLDVRGNSTAPVKRVLLEWGHEDRKEQVSELIIETDVRGIYTSEYQLLTGEFYLAAKNEL
jgi:tRNA1Val (adenine37-N6)-methyltransferase